jgi:hypothetical protein
MGTFDYSGNPEKPIRAHRTIQAEGNKLRWITPFRRHKPTETHADSARGAALRFRQGAAAISGRTAHPRLGPAHRSKLERPSWRNQIIVWRRIGSIGRDRFSRTVAGGGKVTPTSGRRPGLCPLPPLGRHFLFQVSGADHDHVRADRHLCGRWRNRRRSY